MLKYALRGDGCSLGLLAAPLLHSSLGRAKLGLDAAARRGRGGRRAGLARDGILELRPPREDS